MPRAALRELTGLLNRGQGGQWARFVGFSALAVAYGLLTGLFDAWVPLTSAVLLIMLAGFYLRLRFLLLFYLVLAAAVGVGIALRGQATPGTVIVLVVTAILLTRFVRSREALGVQGNTGEAMLIDLRDRLRAQATPPSLAYGLRMESALRSANGEGFSGDFLLAADRPRQVLPHQVGRREMDWPGALEVALVDVSGKGQGAGTRALLLGGGLSGLIATSRVADFLPAANTFLLRQHWAEGFATAVHAVVEQETGQFVVRSAGHLPPLHFHAGTGIWEVLEGRDDPALGLLVVPGFDAVGGRLARGDALVLYTDGMVEARGRDLTYGIDRLTGLLARYSTLGYAGAAADVVDADRANADDDRSVVVIWRD